MEFDNYVRVHATRLMRLATVLCVDSHEAEDVVQEVLLRVHGRWGQVSAMSYPHAYVRRMVVNEAGSWRRKWGRIEARTADVLDRPVADQAPLSDERAALLAAVAALPPRQRCSRAAVLRGPVRC